MIRISRDFATRISTLSCKIQNLLLKGKKDLRKKEYKKDFL